MSARARFTAPNEAGAVPLRRHAFFGTFRQPQALRRPQVTKPEARGVQNGGRDRSRQAARARPDRPAVPVNSAPLLAVPRLEQEPGWFAGIAACKPLR
ncbi:MAG: hypothetical protein D6815_08590 [Candidatus Dadabacteria bacterium]|nr:MAG: hypothetical protein D6815_08590 [Candidatus Dadabacteria bacterium]